MTEEEARATAATIAGASMSVLDQFAGMLLAENARQNLISRSTEGAIWSRHLLDSLQLVRFVRPADRTWIDVGSGAGLPGLVVAALGRWSVTLVEPRRRRVEFLRDVVEALNLRHVSIHPGDVREMIASADLISARAVAKVGELLDLTRLCTGPATRFLLPKGRSAWSEVDVAQASWQGSFHVEHSITDPEAGIVIADRVRRT